METNKVNKIYEDADLLVLDKPSGLIVNKSSTTSELTLQEMIAEKYEYEEDPEDEFNQRAGIVHRLDKDTSGIMVLAKNEKAFRNLLAQFKERKAHKEYLAVLCGKIEEPIIEVDAPIKRNPNSPLKLAIVEGGKEAFTRFELIKEVDLEGEWFTLVRALPKTGRTHQIRVHSLAINHPVALDSIYCTQHLLQLCSSRFNRMMLHAHKLSFTHPGTGKIVEFESKIPEEFSL
jgi:23S rRNA pseudouridine1911/1915/1917 synthase